MKEMVEGVTERAVTNAELTQMEKTLEKEGILVEKDMLVKMYEALEKAIGMVGPLIYNVVKKSAKEHAKELMDQGVLVKDNALDAVLKIIKHYGYAKELEVVQETDNEVRIRGKGLLFGEAFKGKKKNPVDSAIAGFIAGWLEVAWGKRVEAKEVACEAKGDPYCEFVIKVMG